MVKRSIVSNFRIIRPRYESSQSESLHWLAEAHSLADSEVRPELMLKSLERFGCSPKVISRRGHEHPDFTHKDWGRMAIFSVRDEVQGMSARTDFFRKAAESVMGRFYSEEAKAPGNLIHVTCSGYVSPSAAQHVVAQKNWGHLTRVTHAYHMGCYAAFPALRIALGFLKTGDSGSRVDIVHTEICSIHLNPKNHSPEQLVVQTLFADGFIRYSVLEGSEPNLAEKGGLEVLALREEIIPDTEEQMTWMTSDGGMQMTLSREVPVKIAKSLEGFISRLLEQAGLSLEKELMKGIFAIHPGGPRIIDLVQKQLGIPDSGLWFSRKILHDFGNMSSATLPHIWSLIAHDSNVFSGVNIISLAFGPGLTISGGILRKV